jgi:hypothetical protein
VEKYYNIRGLAKAKKAAVKNIIRAAIHGLITMKEDEIVDQFFEKIERNNFCPNDIFEITYTVKILGNDILAAVGAVKGRKLDDNQNKR